MTLNVRTPLQPRITLGRWTLGVDVLRSCLMRWELGTRAKSFDIDLTLYLVGPFVVVWDRGL